MEAVELTLHQKMDAAGIPKRDRRTTYVDRGGGTELVLIYEGWDLAYRIQYAAWFYGPLKQHSTQ